MKKLISALLGICILLSLCACSLFAEPEPTPEPTPTPKPLTELDRWALRTERRYNMDYADFGEYWSLICDDYYGETLTELVKKLSDCENVGLSLADYNKQISDKRAEYETKYGADWHFELKDYALEPLDARANEDFAAEVKKLYDGICVLTNEAEQWSDSSWQYFAEGLGCDLQTAKDIVALYGKLAEKCAEPEVSEAAYAKVTLSYGDKETTRETWVYKLNGAYVSQELIDNSLALINLIY